MMDMEKHNHCFHRRWQGKKYEKSVCCKCLEPVKKPQEEIDALREIGRELLSALNDCDYCRKYEDILIKKAEKVLNV